MPYRRKYSNRRRRVTGKRRLTGLVKRVIANTAETKWYQKAILGGPNAAPATYANLNHQWNFLSCVTGLAQGTDVSNRLGMKIKLKKIVITVRIRPGKADGTQTIQGTGTFCRFVLYHKKQANGAVPAAADFFLTDNVSSVRSPNQQFRSFILRDQSHAMTATSNNGGTILSAGPIAFFQWTIYPKSVVEYAVNTTDNAALVGDDYGVGWCSDDDACCSAVVSSLVYFTDD